MKAEEITKLKADAKKNYGGNLKTAIAAALYGVAVVRRCGNKAPHFADQKLISNLKGQITRYDNAAAAAKKDKAAKAKREKAAAAKKAKAAEAKKAKAAAAKKTKAAEAKKAKTAATKKAKAEKAKTK